MIRVAAGGKKVGQAHPHHRALSGRETTAGPMLQVRAGRDHDMAQFVHEAEAEDRVLLVHVERDLHAQ